MLPPCFQPILLLAAIFASCSFFFGSTFLDIRKNISLNVSKRCCVAFRFEDIPGLEIDHPAIANFL
jgi:hypothetical protein